MKKTLTAMAALLALLACSDILETDISGERVGVIAPADKTEIAEGRVSFLWNLLDGAEKYRVTIVSPNFEHAAVAVKDTILYPDSLDMSLSFRIRLSGGMYQWSLQAFNEAYESVRSIYDLTVVVPEPEKPEPEDEEPEDEETVRR